MEEVLDCKRGYMVTSISSKCWNGSRNLLKASIGSYASLFMRLVLFFIMMSNCMGFDINHIGEESTKQLNKFGDEAIKGLQNFGDDAAKKLNKFGEDASEQINTAMKNFEGTANDFTNYANKKSQESFDDVQQWFKDKLVF